MTRTTFTLLCRFLRSKNATRWSFSPLDSSEASMFSSTSASASSSSLLRPPPLRFSSPESSTCSNARSFSSSPVEDNKEEDDHSSSREGRFAFVDRVRLLAVGGSGGAGCTSFWKNRSGRGGYFGPPDGGPGGKGGSVVLVASTEMKSLRGIGPRVTASVGGSGGASKRVGSAGDHKIVSVPLGTRVFEICEEEKVDVDRFEDDDEDDDEGFLLRDRKRQRRHRRRQREENSLRLVADLSKPGDTFVAASGGQGGQGNASVPRALLAASGSLPSGSRGSPGEKGQERLLRLEVASLADVGLVGPPNVGKSTLLRKLTRARPEVGDYPFTTRRPHLGVLVSEEAEEKKEKGDDDGDNPFLRAARAEAEAVEAASLSPSSSSSSSSSPVIVADVPGLLPGAGSARGTGLGHEFLRHVSRCSALAVVVDASTSSSSSTSSTKRNRKLASDSRIWSPSEQYLGIVEELRAYDAVVAGRNKSGEKRWWSDSDQSSSSGNDRSLADAACNAVVVANKCDLCPDGGNAAVRELREAVLSERRRRWRESGEEAADDNDIDDVVVVAASGKTGKGLHDLARALTDAVRRSNAA